MSLNPGSTTSHSTATGTSISCLTAGSTVSSTISCSTAYSVTTLAISQSTTGSTASSYASSIITGELPDIEKIEEVKEDGSVQNLSEVIL